MALMFAWRDRSDVRYEENLWDRANRARIGGFMAGLIGAGVAIAFVRSDRALVAVTVGAFIVVGAIVGAVVPCRP